MSSHIHLAAVAGWQAVCRIVQPLHPSFAGWLNEWHYLALDSSFVLCIVARRSDEFVVHGEIPSAT